MIRYLTGNEIDFKKYDNCISTALNSRVYANSWYLDIVADKNWDVLVLNDYEAVMPLPKRKKYFINYIFLPPWIQQLGVFSSNEISENLIKSFIHEIPKKFKLIDIFFNSENFFRHKDLALRVNYILSLNKPYEAIIKNYKKGRKSSIKQAQKIDLEVVENYNHIEIVNLFKINKGAKLNKSSVDYNILNALIETALLLNMAECLAVLNKKKELIGGALFLKNNQRFTYLFSSINNEGREKQAMSLLIDYVVKKFSNSKYIFDFEGSMINDIALFFKSFGAEKETYYHFNSKRIF
jgi:hypothetical protein